MPSTARRPAKTAASHAGQSTETARTRPRWQFFRTPPAIDWQQAFEVIYMLASRTATLILPLITRFDVDSFVTGAIATKTYSRRNSR
jgi:hypothetical protein